MQIWGVIIGIGAFLIIGVLHPVVILAEYYWGKQIWPLFAAGGAVCIAASFWVPLLGFSALLAVLGFSLLWSIRELFEQEERVRKGWFPANPHKQSKEAEAE